MPRKENQIMMKQLTENGWGDDPWLLRDGDKGAFANAALIVLAGALPPLSKDILLFLFIFFFILSKFFFCLYI